MAKSSRNTKGKKKNINIGGILNLNIVVERLQKSLLSGGGKKSYSGEKVPEDVKEGHFAVIAEEEDELKRFIVPLNYLTHPSFLRLLELAAEVYGFDHGGALTVPCRPVELERILAERWVEDERVSTVADAGGADKWGSCNETTVWSY
ncbi:hypothetical protein ABFS82_14G241100 [Erythranthe guttata]|nr:PREDICTED: uncharacterized protein LOC105958875 [Erythranthe guttata]|eukprot:XP_012838333.1 PREDICTED: uncharacterized protein LOC105958875 [Erythranthe guttata]